MEYRVIEPIEGKPGRRCGNCGSKVLGKSCAECGTKVAPRLEIGMVAGVAQNFGTVNNVYNMGGEPEIVDLRDIQDGLNERFPERIPSRAPVAQEVNLLPAPRAPSKLVRTVNVMSYVWLVVVVGLMAAALYAVTAYGR